jgi:hypothetical protein
VIRWGRKWMKLLAAISIQGNIQERKKPSFDNIKNKIYRNTSTETDHIGPLKDIPFSNPQAEIKNRFNIK